MSVTGVPVTRTGYTRRLYVRVRLPNQLQPSSHMSNSHILCTCVYSLFCVRYTRVGFMYPVHASFILVRLLDQSHALHVRVPVEGLLHERRSNASLTLTLITLNACISAYKMHAVCPLGTRDSDPSNITSVLSIVYE